MMDAVATSTLLHCWPGILTHSLNPTSVHPTSGKRGGGGGGGGGNAVA